VQFTLRLRNSLGTGTYQVSGERQRLDHLYRRLEDLLKASEPDYPWLHTIWARLTLSAAAAISFTLAALYAFNSAAVQQGMTPILLGLAVGLSSGWGVTGLITNLMTKAFPSCQFEYGPRWRQQKATKRLLYAVVSLLLLPIVFGLTF